MHMAYRLVLVVTLFAATQPTLATEESWSFRAGRGITLNKHANAALAIRLAGVEANARLSMDLAVPESALVETVRGDFVYTKNGEAFLRVPVMLGVRKDGMVEIVDGLFEGDEVVVNGAYDLWMIELQAVNGGRGCADGH